MPPIIDLEDSLNTLTTSFDDNHGNDAHFDPAQPLLGVVLCCTSVPADERADIADKATQMGAVHKYDLTSEVTHLIVGDHDTPKYRYVAKERCDVKVITRAFIDTVNTLWKNDKPIDIAVIQHRYLRPALQDLRICLTGFECMEERMNISSLITQHGGTYSGDLTKQITHLIAYRPEGSKYQYAKTWNIQIVAAEWLYQTIQRGMVLDEKLYSLDLPPEERGKGAWKPEQSSTSVNKRPSVAAGLSDGGQRKLRRTLSKRLSTQNAHIWNDITGVNSKPGLVDSPGQWDRSTEREGLQVATSISIPAHAQPTQLLADIRPILHMDGGGAMDGCTIFIHGFNPKREQHIRTIVLSYDAEIASSLEDLYASTTALSLLVVPHDITPARMPTIPGSAKLHVVTEFWIERCMDAKSFIRPVEYRLGQPFLHRPIKGFNELVVCSTGFTGVQVLQLSKVVTLLGATYNETFSQDHSILICDKNRPVRAEKLAFAEKWKIPVVSIEWLFVCAEQQSKQSYEPYLRCAPPMKESNRPEFRKIEALKGHGSNSSRSVSSNSRNAPPPNVPIVIPSDQSVSTTKEVSQNAAAAEQPPIDLPSEKAATASPLLAEEDGINIIKSETESQTITPLMEISTNSTRKTLPPPEKPEPKDMTFNISSLLASAKNTIPSMPDAPSSSKRGRILGRAASNISAGSARDSRAGSVDSTVDSSQTTAFSASNKYSRTASGEYRSSRMEYGTQEVVDQNDTQYRGGTQLGYEDEASEEHKEILLAKITGKTRAAKKVHSVGTIGSLDSGSTEPISMRTRRR